MATYPFQEMWKRRSLVWSYSIKNMEVRYRGTKLGFVWAVLEPLFLFLILYIVFTSIRDVSEGFAIYLMVGVMMYHVFVRGTHGGMTSVLENSGIIKSLSIKKEFFPLASTGTISLFLMVEVAVLFGLMIFFSFELNPTMLLLPIPLILLLFLILGISYLLSIAMVFVRDIQPIWAVISYALLFVSPIFWRVDEVDGILLEIHKINPVGQLIEITHKIIFGQIPPINDWLYSLAFVFGIFVVCYAVFQKYEKFVAEQL